MLSRVLVLLSLVSFAIPVGAHAQTAPAEIKIGSLHASSGPFASISMPVYYTLKMWIDQKNAEGGVFVKPYNKKIPIKFISYDDQSSTATAATLYNQLITQDKVDLLISEFGLGTDLGGGADRQGAQDVPVRCVGHRRHVLHQGQPLYRADG